MECFPPLISLLEMITITEASLGVQETVYHLDLVITPIREWTSLVFHFAWAGTSGQSDNMLLKQMFEDVSVVQVSYH
jgi:N-dimethylarginine dimethylaminohydrolase